MPDNVSSLSTSNTPAAAGAKGCALAFGGVWIIGWSTVTLLFDIFLAYSVGRQLWAYTYAATPGKVTVSAVDEGRDSDGDATYSPRIGYSYQVDGKQYESERRRYAEISTNGRQGVERVVASHPVGKDITVYYNPASPPDAVLVRGPEGMDLLMGLFMLPFNAVMIGSWAFARASLRSAASTAPPPGVQCRDDGLRAFLRIYPARPWVAACIAAGGTGFAMIFLAAFGQAIAPLFPLALLGWIVVLLIAGLAYGAARRNFIRLEIDSLGGRAELIMPSKPPRMLATAVIESVVWDEVITTDGDGDKKTSCSAVLVLKRDSADAERIALHSWSTRSSAEWVVNWLREKLRKGSERL